MRVLYVGIVGTYYIATCGVEGVVSGRDIVDTMYRDITKRRGWDSNPRTFWVKAFQEPRIRPLCHPSRGVFT